MSVTEVKPHIFTEEQTKAAYMEKGAIFVDAFSRQLGELFFIENREFIGQKKDEVYASDAYRKYKEQRESNFTYVYYPWNNHLVKTVSEESYFTLKTNRNQDLITAKEQLVLRKFRVAVFGMSVGSNIAFVLTQAGISQKITIADFDELDTTNLNRILAGVHQIGLNKTLVAARRIYEDNPFAEVITLDKGISLEVLENMFAAKELDCVIDEIDDIGLKIGLRNACLRYKIPVVMITDNGDGVVLHVERYDLGYDKIFDKDLGYWKTRLSSLMNKELAGDIIIKDIVGGIDKVDPKMVASVKRVFAKELVSWSQLGSAALLGGVIATIAIKRVALGESKELSIVKYINAPELA